jgi:hypothetical protein
MLVFLWMAHMAFADQGNLLAQARDAYVERSIQNLEAYCRGSGLSRHKHFIYLCHLQVKADCEKKIPKACEVLKASDELERQALVSEKVVEEAKPQAIFSSQKSTAEPLLTYQLKYGANRFLEAAPAELRAEIVELEAMRNKLNPLTVSLACDADDQCKLQDYGVKGCGGPMGTIVYSTKSTDSSKILAVQAFNQLDRKIQDEWDKKLNIGDTCEALGLRGTLKCVNSVCELR